MPTAVLIHGAFHGGWCWDKVHPLLEQDGWTVHTPSLTGLGDRAHLASPRITLRTHVQDVVSLMEAEDLTDVTLCGHSYGGMVITAVADAVAERIRTLVYLDAVIPYDGESVFDVLGRTATATFRWHADAYGQGWLVPAFVPAEQWGVTVPSDAAWVTRNLTGHPIGTFTDPIQSTTGLSRVPNKVYVRCTGYMNRPYFDRALAFASNSLGWTVHRWPSAHDVMVTEPARVRELFASVAHAGRTQDQPLNPPGY